MYRIEEARRAAALRRDTPEEEIADGRRNLGVRPLIRNEGVFVVDEGVRIGPFAAAFAKIGAVATAFFYQADR